MSYNLYRYEGNQLPILISVPHCGIEFPDELKNQFDSELTASLDDTDWFVDKLYDFAPALGMTMITAKYSRWVIDLNRNPNDQPLYNDGRIITGLCPTTDFTGRKLYTDGRTQVDQLEVNRRLTLYFRPYHNKIVELLFEIKKTFGVALLWDCHSIRQFVPTIQQEKFPDLILGSADQKSASTSVIETALQSLQESELNLTHNHPFKGGFITRNYGRPNENVHALQLEMTKVNYMDDSERTYSSERAESVRRILKNTLTRLAKTISS